MKTRYWLILTVILLIFAFLTMALSVSADCLPGNTGTASSDVITCTASNQPGTADVQGLDGDDTIVIENGVTGFVYIGGDNTGGANASGNDVIVNDGTINGDIIGDSYNGTGTGSDVIVNNGYADSLVGDSSNNTGSGSDAVVNNGVVVNMNGDSISGNGDGSDNIVNNGGVNEIFGDSTFGDGSGSDSITNNGSINEDLYADTYSGTGSGNDSVTNNGVIGGNIYGDSELGSSTGNDNIVNNGAVNGNIIAGGGDDTVTIAGNGVVNGVMDGGAGYDVLNFNLTTSDPEELLEIAAQIAAANPAGGTLTIRGIVYTWQNFEELRTLLISLVRINSYGDPFAVFCALGGGIDVYNIVGNQGILAQTISGQVLANAISSAQENGVNVVVARSATNTVYALASGEVQVNSPDGTDYSFSYIALCGILPIPRAIAEEVEPDTFTIINRPR